MFWPSLPMPSKTTRIPACESASTAVALKSHQLTVTRGVAEHSHRSELATNILNTMKADLASFLDVPSDYEILLMQGASTAIPISRSWLTLRSWRIGTVRCDDLQCHFYLGGEAAPEDREGKG